ncbi:TPM domain-containing protein [Mycobacteroides abscessus]|uniref:TPM domain-containing protein n=1 Tax=Mycobacteroides abscessus TaxID=36809 RepID=UPI000C25B579|nr:TPM domain-containing protein [Mycobacteroides abscessus]
MNNGPTFPCRHRVAALLTALTTIVLVWSAILAAVAPARAAANPHDNAAIEDSAAILTPADLSAAMDSFSKSTGLKVTVVTTTHTSGQSIQAYATSRAAALGRDRGPAIVIGADMGSRNLGIYTTPDAEDRLPNAELNAIVTNVLAPSFANRQYSRGISDSLSAISDYLTSTADRSDTTTASLYKQMGLLGGLGIALAVAAAIARMIVKTKGATPQAGQRDAQAASSAARRAEIETFKPELEALESPRERFQLARSRTGVTASEWNMWFPQWFCYDMSRAAASTVASDTAATTASMSSGFLGAHTIASYSPSFDSSASCGGFSDGGGASASF